MRARNIKPGFFENEDLHEISLCARLVFIGMWCIADREGRLEDRPKKIKLQLIPYDNEDIDQCLHQLTERDFITRYVVDGKRYIQVNNFSKHQKPHPNETQSIIPPPSAAKFNIAQALIDEVITEDDAGMTIDDAHAILNTMVNHGAPLANHGSPLVTNSSPCSADSLNDDSLNDDSLNDDCLISCPEPCRASGPPPPRARADAEPVCTIPTNRYTTAQEEFAVTQELAAELQDLYPSVDIAQELKAIRAWNLTNPTKRKTLSGIPKHINAWLAKEQNRGNGRHPPEGQGPKLVSKVTERNMAVIQAARAMEAQNGKT